MFSGLLFSSKPKLHGIGSSFFAPVILKWAEQYYLETGIKINYQPFGSGVGIKQVLMGTVDFGASDMPLPPSFSIQKQMIQFPIVAGAIVPIVNLKGVLPGGLILDLKTMAAIFSGRIEFWDDVAIKKINPKIALSHKKIRVVVRADGSGTTYNFTRYLGKDKIFFDKVGLGTSVEWPRTFVRTKGNEGVSAMINQISDSIGYVELSYALQNKMSWISLLNESGKISTPSKEAVEAAVLAEYNPRLKKREILKQREWPLIATTFVILHSKKEKTINWGHLKDFFSWVQEKGYKLLAELDYIAIPFNVNEVFEQRDFKKVPLK